LKSPGAGADERRRSEIERSILPPLENVSNGFLTPPANVVELGADILDERAKGIVKIGEIILTPRIPGLPKTVEQIVPKIPMFTIRMIKLQRNAFFPFSETSMNGIGRCIEEFATRAVELKRLRDEYLNLHLVAWDDATTERAVLAHELIILIGGIIPMSEGAAQPWKSPESVVEGTVEIVVPVERVDGRRDPGMQLAVDDQEIRQNAI
jgi:hypothetical protein